MSVAVIVVVVGCVFYSSFDSTGGHSRPLTYKTPTPAAAQSIPRVYTHVPNTLLSQSLTLTASPHSLPQPTPLYVLAVETTHAPPLSPSPHPPHLPSPLAYPPSHLPIPTHTLAHKRQSWIERCQLASCGCDHSFNPFLLSPLRSPLGTWRF